MLRSMPPREHNQFPSSSLVDMAPCPVGLRQSSKSQSSDCDKILQRPGLRVYCVYLQSLEVPIRGCRLGCWVLGRALSLACRWSPLLCFHLAKGWGHLSGEDFLKMLVPQPHDLANPNQLQAPSHWGSGLLYFNWGKHTSIYLYSCNSLQGTAACSE